jgi:hypothetical protein
MTKSKEIQAPNDLTFAKTNKCIFLAGSIEMGKAENWQKRIVDELSDKGYTFLNPRRDDWDSSWEQKIENKQFNEQVSWELKALELADIIVMYFDPNTQSPISLLELGLHARDGKLIVLCPEGFWRKGNVDIVCEKYGVKQVESFEELIKAINE